MTAELAAVIAAAIAASEGTSTDGFRSSFYQREENQINGINQEDMKMKNYTITVNGNVYDVTVEEKGAGAVPAAPAPDSSS